MPPAQSRASVITGIGDEHTAMFYSRYWKQLHMRITRYITPYDVVAHRRELSEAKAWIQTATAAHQEILVAFYHSEQSPTKMPSPALYKQDVTKFLKVFPQVHQYQPWNEANRGYIPHMLQSPSPMQSALYYRELRSVAHTRTVLGLDILDSFDIGPTLTYVNQFKSDLKEAQAPDAARLGLPQLLRHEPLPGHAHEGRARRRPRRTLADRDGRRRAVRHGLHEQARCRPASCGTSARLHVQARLLNARIKRLYIYDWTGAGPRARFDAGLTDAHGRPRKGYVAVCDHLLHNSKKCRVRTVND